MSELLPTVQAGNVRQALVDYLTTTFALSDDDARVGLDRFLSDPVDGMFKGPYVRLRLPFRPAADGWRDALQWYQGFPPYGHQAAAFARLSSSVGGTPRAPLPTLVTTGTGSGKTESFLYPILDHVLRARRSGISGTKALILYPMNALANDQAQRLARILTDHAALGGITAALYTGQDGPARTSVTADGLITDRAIVRDSAPDILLTNYKMLDQMLLRAEDQRIWRASATSLQYLVLDEFHTYDGAQGTDVAMLLRRLGLSLKSYWADGDPAVTAADRSRPLGRITPVATSATLGDKGDPKAMLGFAETVFGVPFGGDAVITETRLLLPEWIGNATELVGAQGIGVVPPSRIDVGTANVAVSELGTDPPGAALTLVVLGYLYSGPLPDDPAPDQLLDLMRAHPLVAALAEHAADAVALADLPSMVLGEDAMVTLADPAAGLKWQRFLSSVIAALGHVRALAGRSALAVEAHLWVRELTRIDRAADSTAQFRWSDDGPPVAGLDSAGVAERRPSFPAVFCRECGRSGWGVALAPVGSDLAGTDDNIRRDHARGEGRFRALLFAAREADEALRGGTVDGLAWFSVRSRQLLFTQPAEDDPDLRDGWVLPVLTSIGPDADSDAKRDTCPSCGQQDTIRFVGSAIATLLSVSLSTLFGSATLDAREKKALVFTDSVQDAAHRAGFIQARSHTLTLRAVWRDALADGPLTLDALVENVIERAENDPVSRYRMLPPDWADRAAFSPFWTTPEARAVPRAVLERVRRRLALDAALEFGLNSRTGRTLELTGSAAVEVDAGNADDMAAAARTAIDGLSWPVQLDGTTDEPDDATLVRWVRGVLDRMRAQGAVDHPWFERYRRDDGNRYSIWFGRPRGQGMPAFPNGRPAPAYPRVGGARAAGARGRGTGADGGLDPVTSAQSWYARWGSRVLNVSPADAGTATKHLLDRLSRDGTLQMSHSASGAAVYAIPRTGVMVMPIAAADLSGGRHLLVCDTCRAQTPGSVTAVEQLAGAPCLVVRCRGHLDRATPAGDFYRQLYRSSDMRRIVAREHTSLLTDETRRSYEDGFKGAAADPQAPNVLVATPTLEMGIDIGDLSTVFLASLPRTVASYLQRIGRAGRLTGNALDLAFVTGRGEQLPNLGEPLSVINGEVRPPATFLRAEEILKRQYTAHLVDEVARGADRSPRRAAGVIGSTAPGSFLGNLIAQAESHADSHVQRFLAQFGDVSDDVAGWLRDWVTTSAGPASSAFADHLRRASATWQTTVTELQRRLAQVDALQPELETRAASPAATDDDRRALRSVLSARALTNAQLSRLRGEYWIGVLEQYGVLPNYTLLGDAVVLDVGISWTNPDTNQFESEPAQIARSSAGAIAEFAPGSTFYARGLEIYIDAVDLGLDGAAIRPWVFCPRCGFGADIALTGVENAPTRCPRCGSTDIADTGQRMDVVELTHVSAEVRRDEATISDRADERTRSSFQLITAADVDPAAISKQWFAGNTGIGVTYAREVTVRWLNIGTAGQGQDRFVAGQLKSGALFRVCAGCGKLDVVAGRNVAYEHRPWCRYRTAAEEHNRLVALTRTLRTQGLLIRLPRTVTVGDDFAVPSLSAAVLLGLREQIGGHPDHLRIEQVVEATLADGNANHDAILLHDTVPGGTGYLAGLADPAEMKALLGLAWDKVRTCECRFENRLACHRCLLPFATGSAANRVSRAAAERHLRTLLGMAPEASSMSGAHWEFTEHPPTDDPESHLEQRFRQVMTDRLTATGAAIDTVPGPWGNALRFTLPGSPRRWTLTPQVQVDGTRPDFLLETNDTQVPAVAIFVDGRAFHASAQHNRLADDAEKRAVLRASGRIVLAVTAADLTDPSAPPWFNDAAVSAAMTQPQLMTTPAAYQRLACGPVQWLLEWITAPTPDETRITARAVPLFLLAGSTSHAVAVELSLDRIALDVLTGATSQTGARNVMVWRDGPAAAAVEMVDGSVRVAVVLDDRAESLGENHAVAWHSWLRLSNALAMRDWPTVITTVTRISYSVEVAPSMDSNADVPAPWLPIYRSARAGVERELVVALAVLPGMTVPELGVEGPDGIPIDIAWRAERLAITVADMPEADRADLAAAGWTVLDSVDDSVIERVVAALSGGQRSPDHPKQGD